MKHPDPTAIFCLCCIAWGLVVAILIGGCGGAQRTCHGGMNRSGDGNGDRCEVRR